MKQNPSRVGVSKLKKLLFAGLLLSLVLFPTPDRPAQADTVTFTTGTTNFTVPAGVTSITVEVWGGGGAGGAGGASNKYGGGGGAGGQYATKVVTVVPGNSYSMVVGAGGATTAANGNKGGNSYFNGTAVVAVGGNGGLSYANGRTGGAGSTTGGVGTTVYAGGSGATGATTYSGGGGGGAGSSGAGGAASTSGAGTGRIQNGGNGGAGSTASIGAGGVGGSYGGGGGGATRSGAPGAGGPGYAKITYTIPSFTLTYTAGDNGTITGTSPQTVVAGGSGTEVTASPKPGYHFLRWSDSSTTNPRTDKEVAANINVTAEFEIDASFTLMYDATVGGSITGTAIQYVAPGGSGTAVTAVPNANYHFVKWSDLVTANPRTDTNVSANISVTAVFQIDTHILTYIPGSGGYLSGTATQYIDHGSNGTAVQAMPNTGYHFVNWSDGITSNPRTDTNVLADKTVTANFALNTYTLTYTAGANGTVTGTSPQTVNHGANGTAVTAAPSTGYHFVQWSDGSTANPRTETNVTANKSVSATFAINTYTLTYTAGANGTITGTSPQTVNHGANGTAVTAAPSTGYHFVQWSDGNTSNPRTHTNVTGNISVSATFAINTYTLTYTAGAGGSVTGTSPQTVNHGANGTAVTANATTGYTFTQWSDGITSNPRTDLNVTGNKSVTAQFTINTYTLTYTAGANGTVTGTSPQTVNHGANGTAVTATPNANFTFSQWSDGITANPRTDTNVTANKSVTAQFTAVAANYTLTYTAGANGTITGTSPQTVVSGGNGTAVTANPSSGYHFVNWSDGGTANPRTDTNVTANKSVTANFAINVYTLLYDAGAGGSLTGTATQYINHGSSGTAVTAVANTGYHFVQWSDGGTANPRTETNVTNNKSFTASFAINTYTVTFTAGAGGTITGTSPQTINYGANATAVTATANTGYHFVQWSDSSTTNPRTETNVTSNRSFTASFAINTYTLTYTAGAGGSVTGTSPQTVNHGANGTAVTATPSTGYRFVQWSDGITTAARTETNVTANKTVSASFAILTYTLTYTAGANGTVSGVSPQTVNHGANGTAVTATPNANFTFSQWSDGITQNPRTDLNVTANKSVTASFSAVAANYTLTYTAGANGSITGTSPQTVVSGGNGTAVTAVPAANYHFVQWSDGVLTASRTETNVTANKSVTATFAINSYTLLYDAGVGGTITGTATQYVNHGSNGTAVTATPSTGYHFVQWSDTSTTNPRTELNVTANKSLTATFAINTYTLTYASGANGTVSGVSPQTVNNGANGTPVTANPSANYHFVQWSDGNMTNPRTDLNVTANKSVTASFAMDYFKLSYGAESNGTLTGETTQQVNIYGSGTAVTAVPDSGYNFETWSDGMSANPRTDTNVTANIEVFAKFTPQASTYTLTYTAGANGTISGTSPQVVASGDNGSEVLAVANANYHFVNWSDGVTDELRVEKNVTANKSVTANFAIDVHTLIYDAGAGGYITGTAIQFVNHGGNGTAVQAVANSGYSFVRWSDGITANPRTDTNVLTDKSATAIFSLNNLTLTYTAGANGSISGTSPQSVPYGGNGTAVTANPVAGYRFTQWSDGSTQNPRTDTNVTVSKTVSAAFAANTFTLIYTADTNGTITGTSPQTVNYGGSGTAVTATANTGYHFTQWSDGNTSNPRTNTNVTADASYQASFAPNTFTLTYAAGAGGTISGPTPQTVNYGDNGLAVTAVPNASYNFSQWSDGITANPRTDVNVIANKSVTAQFSAAAATYTLTYSTTANGAIIGASPQTVVSGGNGSAVTASPDPNYHFVNWSDSSTANPRTDTNVTSNKSVTANFAIDTHTVIYDAGVGGTLTGTTVQYIGYGGAGTAVTAVGNTGYHFVQWSDGNTSNPRTESNVTADKSVTASFALNTYTITYSAGTGGSITGSASQTVNHGGNGTLVTAVPAAEYEFIEWSDGVATAARTETNVTSAKNLTANFNKPGVNNNSISGGTNAFMIGSFSGGLVADIPLKLKYTSYTTVAGSEIFNDKTPYSNNAQNYGASALATELVFDGSNDYAVVSTSASLQPQTSMTLSAWVKPNAVYASDVIMIGTGAYYLTVGSDWSFKTYWYGKSSPGYHSSGAGTLSPGQWNLITAVWSATDAKMYVNGILKNTVASTGTGTAAGQLWIGAENASGARAFKGSIANLKIYNKALTADEVDDLYGQGLEESAFMLSGQN